MAGNFMHDDRSNEPSLNERRRLIEKAKNILKKRGLAVPDKFSDMEEKFLRGEISIYEIDDEISKYNEK